jgi:hypothetical protein
MAVPRRDAAWLDRFVAYGANGFSINVEVYGSERAEELIRLKHRSENDTLTKNLERAVAATGGRGRVRSLIVAGLESLEVTLQAVDYVASLGCDPVLSPFRPASGTELSKLPPPTVDFMERLYLGSVEIVDRYGVKLGPRCIPCQHNTLSFPDGSGQYYFS